MSGTEGHMKGRVALVTGASRTLGAAIAAALARRGAAVAVNYNASEAAAKELCARIEADGGRAAPIQADVTEPGDMARLVNEAQDGASARSVPPATKNSAV